MTFFRVKKSILVFIIILWFVVFVFYVWYQIKIIFGSSHVSKKLSCSSIPSYVVKKKQLNYSVILYGKIWPLYTSKIKVPKGKVILKISVREGSVVKKGQVLIYLDSGDLKEDLKVLYKELELYKARLKKKEMESKILGNVSLEELALLKLQVAKVEKKIFQSKKSLEECLIKAPFEGVITDISEDLKYFLEVGEIVKIPSSDDSFIEISSEKVVFLTNVEQDKAIWLHNGQSVDIRIEGFNSRALKGKIYYIGKKSNIEGFPLKILIDEEIPVDFRGLKATARVNIMSQGEVIVVPIVFVQENENMEPFVLVEKGNKLEQRFIETGFKTDTEVEVRSGLKEGERIFLSSNQSKIFKK